MVLERKTHSVKFTSLEMRISHLQCRKLYTLFALVDNRRKHKASPFIRTYPFMLYFPLHKLRSLKLSCDRIEAYLYGVLFFTYQEGSRFMMYVAVSIHSPQNLMGILAWKRIVLAISNRCLCFLSTTPFCCEV